MPGLRSTIRIFRTFCSKLVIRVSGEKDSKACPRLGRKCLERVENRNAFRLISVIL